MKCAAVSEMEKSCVSCPHNSYCDIFKSWLELANYEISKLDTW